jgi:hypothetical protein
VLYQLSYDPLSAPTYRILPTARRVPKESGR